MLTLIKRGRVVDPGNCDGIRDIVVRDGKIDSVSEQLIDIDGGRPDVFTIDASEKIVSPGLIDMHVHLREPGHEYKETIATGCQSAAAGGFTSICAMANTDPVNDNSQVTKFILHQARLAGSTRVFPVGAVSIGLQGRKLCEYGEMKRAGVVALSDDGRPVQNSLFMRRALEYAKGFDLPLIVHCEVPELSEHGVMNEGALASRLGLSSIPNAAESIMVMRDIELCKLTGSPIHIAHVSTAEAVQAIRNAKQQGLPVTAETAPHYFTLTEEAVGQYNTSAKMNPPLRSFADREAVREGLSDRTIDVIASDHAPHSSLEKDLEFDAADNGIIGMETSLSLGLKLVHNGCLTMVDLIEKMAKNPVRILKLTGGLLPNGPADLTVIDPDIPFVVHAADFKSLSRNTPFDRWELKGKAVLTMVGGRIIHQDDEFNKTAPAT